MDEQSPTDRNQGAMGVVHERRRSRHAPDARTVEDLLSAQRYHIEVPVDALERTGTGIHPVLQPPAEASSEQRRPESTWSKVAKLAGLTTATSLLVGAVVASSVLSRERSEAAPRPNPAPPQITGAAALGGFVPEDPKAARPSTGSSPHQYSTGTPSMRQLAEADGTGGGGPAALAAPGSSSVPSHLATSGEKIALVERFYHRMVNKPEDALAMLAPGLAGDEPGDLVRAWSSMQEVHVDEVEVRQDDTVRASVTMLQRDGTKLRVAQLLGLSGADDNLITRAVLLSAEQL